MAAWKVITHPLFLVPLGLSGVGLGFGYMRLVKL